MNNIVKQDYWRIKCIVKPMMGFKYFEAAQAIIAGIELHHMLRKEQHTDTVNQAIFEQFYTLAG